MIVLLETNANYKKSILINLDRDIFDNLDLDGLQLPMVLHLMLYQAFAYSNGDETFSITPKGLYDFMIHGDNGTKVTTVTRSKILETIKGLASRKFIAIDKEDFKWDNTIEVDASNLLHKEGKRYLSMDSKILGIIMRNYGLRSTKMIVTYFNIRSYFNWEHIMFYQNEFIDKGVAPSFSTLFGSITGDWGLACFASLKTLASKPYNEAMPFSWVSEKTLSKNIHALEKLKLISIVTVEGICKDGKKIVYNYYCLPQYRRAVEFIAKRKLQQTLYSIDNK